MHPKLPLPRGWTRRIQSSVHTLALGCHTPTHSISTANVLVLQRPESVAHYTRLEDLASRRHPLMMPIRTATFVRLQDM
ncbi:MAG: hypothetical protein O7B35_02475 [Deltaproteobacteria bacterium]|nr:hypothetical protein [Deltaproteobacteria bacterium]